MYQQLFVKMGLGFVMALVLGLFVMVPAGPAFAGSFGTPERGSAERKAIMNALRVPAQKALGQKVIFVVNNLRMGDGWAFLSGTPKKPSGKKIDYRNTRYNEAVEMGMFDDGISALLFNSGSGWKVLAMEIGATDVPWAAWPDQFGAPSGLFE